MSLTINLNVHVATVHITLAPPIAGGGITLGTGVESNAVQAIGEAMDRIRERTVETENSLLDALETMAAQGTDEEQDQEQEQPADGATLTLPPTKRKRRTKEQIAADEAREAEEKVARAERHAELAREAEEATRAAEEAAQKGEGAPQEVANRRWFRDVVEAPGATPVPAAVDPPADPPINPETGEVLPAILPVDPASPEIPILVAALRTAFDDDEGEMLEWLGARAGRPIQRVGQMTLEEVQRSIPLARALVDKVNGK